MKGPVERRRGGGGVQRLGAVTERALSSPHTPSPCFHLRRSPG